MDRARHPRLRARPYRQMWRSYYPEAGHIATSVPALSQLYRRMSRRSCSRRPRHRRLAAGQASHAAYLKTSLSASLPLATAQLLGVYATARSCCYCRDWAYVPVTSSALSQRYRLEQRHAAGAGKGRYQVRLPLPQEVATRCFAILLSPPDQPDGSRFLRSIAPVTSFASSDGVSSVVKHALRRAGIEVAAKGAHLLRHTAATEMLRHGVPLIRLAWSCVTAVST